MRLFIIGHSENTGSKKKFHILIILVALFLGISFFCLYIKSLCGKAAEPPLLSASFVNFKHGNEQVVKMLSDRPAMKFFLAEDGQRVRVSSNCSIWNWAANAYGGAKTESTIEWDYRDSSKPDHYRADHVLPSRGTKGRIRIREKFRDEEGLFRLANFEELWSACIFELINIQNAEQFAKVFKESLQGTIDKDTWILLNTELEHQALRNLNVFFDNIWRPWALKSNFHSNPKLWGEGVPEDYFEWFSMYSNNTSSNYNYWGNYYDDVILKYLNLKTKFSISN